MTLFDEPAFTIACAQWVSLLDQLDIGAFTIDRRRRITSFNQSVQALTGVHPETAMGKDCRWVFGMIPCYMECPFHEVDHSQPEASVELVDSDSCRHYVTRIATPLYGTNHQIAGCLTILHDHSPLANLVNKLNYEKRSLKLILDNLDIGIFTVNRGGLLTFFNQAAEKISGYTRRQLLGKHCNHIFQAEGNHDTAFLKAVMRDGNPRSTSQGGIKAPQGETIPIKANYLPLRNEKGEICGGLATFQDLTLIHQLNQAIHDRYTFHDMIGKAPAMLKIFEMTTVVAATDATVLLEGPTGTGKDLLAKIIHSNSRRADKPMVKVNCAALPDSLLESEFFGYAKGAFTGADKDKPGRFTEADGGTIFLDEIGDLPLSLQAKLLRVIEEKEFYPLGGRQTRKVDVRIISATNQDLARLISEGRFREDLYYRLNVVRIDLPPLKDRLSDLPMLIAYMVRRLCLAMGKPVPTISQEAMETLLKYDYPGNVRELENILEHALIICREKRMRPDHLPEQLHRKPFRRISRNEPGRLNVGKGEDAERRRILQALRQHQWNRQQTAKALHMDRTTLWRKMKQYHILPESTR